MRAIGFNTFADSIAVAAGQTLDGELTLSPVVTTLDRIRTTATAVRNIPPALREFESRRKSSPTGYFLGDSALRRHDSDDMSTLIGMLPSVRTVLMKTKVYLASARSQSTGPALKASGSSNCLFTVYQDGMKIFQAGDGSDPPDFGHMRVDEFAGVEVYPSASETPAQYSATGTGCGVILLWSKR
jgi:hypothetical protein